ncbi:hypothetical protein QQF64_031683 [Cirrhinus molitorella]|uniref:Uncharacterized protein n=1 Tax=Cirrhinus molitorella TaxID=172907 RepID=A0ABR3MXN2_9TELE
MSPLNLWTTPAIPFEPIEQQTAAMQPPGPSSSQIIPSETSSPGTSTQSQSKVDEIVTLWDKLSDHDKGPLIYPTLHHERQLKGHFKSPPLEDHRDPWHRKSEEKLPW